MLSVVLEATVSCLWKNAQKTFQEHGHFYVQSNQDNCDRPKLYDCALLEEAIEELPAHKRKTQRLLAWSLGVSLGTVQRLIHSEEIIMPIQSRVKPMLTDQNKFERAMFAASRVDENGIFHGMYDQIFIDKKWFFTTEAANRVYVTKKEKQPKRAVKSKKNMIKVMFLTAVACPCYDENGVCTFDGKIGMWPFVEKVPAQRSSANRPAGTIETKTVNVNKEVYSEFLCEKLAPAVKELWPDNKAALGEAPVVMKIIQDNAKPHI